MLLFTYRFPQTDNIPIQIREPRKAALAGNLDRRHECFAAELFGFVEVCLQIIHLHVNRSVVMWLMPERGDMAVNAFRAAGIGQCGRALHVDLPIKSFAKNSCVFTLLRQPISKCTTGCPMLYHSFLIVNANIN